jgi:hypothetical protein
LRLTLHWDQGTRLKYKCHYAESYTRFLHVPEDGDPERGEGCAVIDEDLCQRNGFRLPLPMNGAPIWVTIWPVISLGWKDVAGKPLHIGPIAAARRGGAWFGWV